MHETKCWGAPEQIFVKAHAPQDAWQPQIIAYFQKKAAQSKNKLLSAVLCCLQCCMWCFEKCMKFLNKNAYIQTAIHSYSFCTAAKKAFFLILRNIARIAAVSMVGDFVLLLGKLLIPLATTFVAYICIMYTISEDLNGIVVPLVLTALLSLFTVTLFNEVFGMAISTILQCFVADEEMFKPEERFAQGSLSATISKVNEKAAASKKVAPSEEVEEAPKAEII